jgi:uncharacterized protein (DUF305 family)
MENKNILYGVIGLLIGIVITNCFLSYNNHWNKYRTYDRYSESKGMMHQMPDGTMMGNVGMDMDSMMSGMMMGLKGKTGDAFDKEFLSEMVVHHQGAVEMAKAVLATSKRPELIKLANDIISAQNKEIEMMQGWQKSWFK